MIQRVAYLCMQATQEGQASYAHVNEIINGLRRRGVAVDLFEPRQRPGRPRPGLLGRAWGFLAVQIRQEDTATRAAQRYLDIATARYQTGLDPYLAVITAQAALLADQQAMVNLRVAGMTASVRLVQALGGGWDLSRLPGPDQAAPR